MYKVLIMLKWPSPTQVGKQAATHQVPEATAVLLSPRRLTDKMLFNQSECKTKVEGPLVFVIVAVMFLATVALYNVK